MPSGLPRTGWSRRRRSLADARRRGWRSRCCARSWRSAAMADAYLEDYREQGFAVVRGVFALAEMREMAEAFDRVYAQGMAHRASFRRSEEHTSELQSLMRISYAVFGLKEKKKK